MSIWSRANTAWGQLNAALRMALLALGIAAVCATSVTLTVLAWRSGLLHDQLGLPAPVTKADLQEQTDALRYARKQEVDSIVDAAIFQYDLSARMWMAEERRMVTDTAYKPMLHHMKAITDVVVELRRNAVATDHRVRELPKQFDEQLTRMIEAVDPVSREQKIDEVLRQNADLLMELEQLRKEVQPDPRTKRIRKIEL